MKLKKSLCAVLAALLCLTMVACSSASSSSSAPAASAPDSSTADASTAPSGRVIPEGADPIVITSFDWTSGLLMSQMTYDYLKSLGYPVEAQFGLGNRGILRAALKNDEVDMYWEYDGSILMGEMGSQPIREPDACYDAVKKWDYDNNKIVWLERSGVNDTYVWVVTKETADQYNLKTFSDFVEQIKNGAPLIMSAGAQYQVRDDGLPMIESIYDFKMPRNQCVELSMGLDPEALINKQIHISSLATTDPKISEYGLVPLTDDKQAFQNYYTSPIVREDLLETYPNLAEDMAALSKALTTEEIVLQVKKIDIDKRSEQEVSLEYLKELGLIQ